MCLACTTNSSIVDHFQRVLDADASKEKNRTPGVLLVGEQREGSAGLAGEPVVVASAGCRQSAGLPECIYEAPVPSLLGMLCEHCTQTGGQIQSSFLKAAGRPKGSFCVRGSCASGSAAGSFVLSVLNRKCRQRG